MNFFPFHTKRAIEIREQSKAKNYNTHLRLWDFSKCDIEKAICWVAEKRFCEIFNPQKKRYDENETRTLKGFSNVGVVFWRWEEKSLKDKKGRRTIFETIVLCLRKLMNKYISSQKREKLDRRQRRVLRRRSEKDDKSETTNKFWLLLCFVEQIRNSKNIYKLWKMYFVLNVNNFENRQKFLRTFTPQKNSLYCKLFCLDDVIWIFPRLF